MRDNATLQPPRPSVPVDGVGISNSGTLTVGTSMLSGNFDEAIATLDVRGSTFSGNTASDSGGTLYSLGTATIQESTLSGNTAGSAGGGIFNGTSGTLAIDDSVVCDNLDLLGADLYNLGEVALNGSRCERTTPSHSVVPSFVGL